MHVKELLSLKDKIVLSEKLTGKKIDDLDSFDNTLKGNGDPGIWESIRTMKRNIKIILWILAFIVLLELGGNWRGVTFDKIREKLGMKTTQVKEKERSDEWFFTYPPVVEDPNDVSVILKEIPPIKE